MKARLYLDYAAATPLDDEVRQAIDSHKEYYANPSAKYSSARESKKVLESLRKQIAACYNCSKSELIFTSSSTESNNLAIFGAVRPKKSGRIISIRTEHPSIYEPLMQLKKAGFEIDWCNIDEHGLVDLQHLGSLVASDTILVTIALANSTTGTIQPVSKISKLIESAKKQNISNPIFHTDATGAQPSMRISVDKLGVDMITVGSSKIYGPNAGIVYIKRGVYVEPIIFGGKQEFGMRAGTEDISHIAGLAKAISIQNDRLKQDAIHYQRLYDYFQNKLSEKSQFTNLGHPHDRIHNVVNIAFDNINGEDVVAYLDAVGIEVATGAACQAANEKPSRILLAMGVKESLAQGSLRISFGRDTTIKDIDRLVDGICSTVSKLRR